MALLKLKLKKPDPELEALLKVRPPVRVKIFLIKRRHLKRLEELSQKSLGEIPQLKKPTKEQNKWINRRMRASAKSWEAYRR